MALPEIFLRALRPSGRAAYAAALIMLGLPGAMRGAGESRVAAGTGTTEDSFFRGFVAPPAEARPFLRWWWNGNQITAAELSRQLDVLHAAGVGGVEINPIAMPEEAEALGIRPVPWLTREWNDLLALASREAKQRGMVTELIVGSGWPFGGEFLKPEEFIERVIVHRLRCPGGTAVDEDEASLVRQALAAQSRQYEAAESNKVLFASLVPVHPDGLAGVVDLSSQFQAGRRLQLRMPPGEHELVYGVLQRGHRQVMYGAPGAAGPVMNHYDAAVTRSYLNRLDKIPADTGVPLQEMVRTLFCDSIELAGANWTPGFAEVFQKTYGYRLEPYFPFVFYDSHLGYASPAPDGRFGDEIRRVRYDYNKLLVQVFLDSFVRPFADFCRERGVQSRYQSYGTPFLMGLLEGAMIPDVPESNNWLYSGPMEADEWNWNQVHGYLVWNLYTASAAHLTGKKVVSCEAMTNTKGVFKTPLEEIKRQDDMNFITGMNHTILHGYNYSPAEAKFPGWVRYGTYFSERNTWWPFFNKWADYNARLSYVFQNSQPVKDVAVLAPAGDLWSDHGLARVPFHTLPWYAHRLWEPLSQAGSSCDYVNEDVIRQAAKRGGRLEYGPMSYQAIVLCQVRSLEPGTAEALREFVAGGGRVALVDGVPARSLARKDAGTGDAAVRDVFDALRRDFPERCLVVAPPADEDALLPWTDTLLRRLAVARDVESATPSRDVFQIRARHGDAEVYFFVNSHRTKPARIKARFPTGERTAWIWSPETGRREPVPAGANANEIEFELQGLESRLLVFGPGSEEKLRPDPAAVYPAHRPHTLRTGPWRVSFQGVDGRTFERHFDQLREFGTAADPELRTFAGTVTYETTFEVEDITGWLQLEKSNGGVTEAYLNGHLIGTNWYGRPRYAVDGAMRRGENRLKLVHVTVLSNYCRSLTDNPTTERWTQGFQNIPLGLEGEVQLLNTRD